MAHKIFENSFASKKEPAWHGLGKVVDAMTSKEAIILGGLNFEVSKRPLFIQSNLISFKQAKEHSIVSRNIINDNTIFYSKLVGIEDKFATVRDDLNLPLGIVGSRYEIIQNQEAFDFFDSIVGEKYADYETVGCLNGGGTIFITAKLKEEMIINKDNIDKYLLLTMSHDGTSSIQVMFTPIRVVCNNTLTLALGGKNKMTIRHTKSAKDKLEASKKVLGIVDSATLTYQEIFGNMFKIHISDIKAEQIIEKCLSITRDEKGFLSTKAENIIDNVIDYYNHGIGQNGIIGTGWGLFNGITGYLQNAKEYKDTEAKFKNTFQTSAVTVRELAYNLIINEN